MPTPRHGRALLAALLASALAAASAQPSRPGVYDDYMSGQRVHVSTAMIVLLAAVIAVFVFIAFFTVYLRHCTGYALRRDDDRAAAPNFDAFISRSRRLRRPRGLDAAVVEAFPTMKYAEARALRVGKGGALECAVCLSEFEDEERLRLLPKCSHAFHPECIGEWLASHVTCPVCRCNLDPNKDTSSDEDASFPSIPVASSISSETAVARMGDGPLPVAVVIDVVTEEEEEERRQEALELQQIGTQRRAMRSRSGRRTAAPTQLARSHSTGHSLALRLDRDLERFTLRLPEHVRREIVAAGEHSSQLRRGRRAGEGSSRGGRSGPLGRAGRWQSLLARTFSGKLSFFSASRMTVSSDRGEVSSTLSTRLRGKRVAAVDAADVPTTSVRLDRIGGSASGAKAGAASGEAAAAAEADEEKAVTQQLPT